MTKDDTIRMARVAGVRDDGHRFEFGEYKYLQRFAALVAAAERESCAELCDGLDDDLVDGLAGWQYGEAIRARGEQA
jgi:hypothetical protein